jgi:hypothetical protein
MANKIDQAAENVRNQSVYEQMQSAIAAAKAWATAQVIENGDGSTASNVDNSPPPPVDFNTLLNALMNVSTTEQLIDIAGAVYDQQAFLRTMNEINKQPSAYLNEYAQSLTDDPG